MTWMRRILCRNLCGMGSTLEVGTRAEEMLDEEMKGSCRVS